MDRSVIFEPLNREHDRSSFTCGDEALDRYFREHARQNVEQGIAAVFVMRLADSDGIAGFYSLSTGSVQLTALPPELQKRLPRYPEVPVVVLGRMAVSTHQQGLGLGGVLLVNALKRAQITTDSVGAVAVVVDAKNERARSFYEGHGFVRFPDQDFRLLIRMKTIASLP